MKMIYISEGEKKKVSWVKNTCFYPNKILRDTKKFRRHFRNN